MSDPSPHSKAPLPGPIASASALEGSPQIAADTFRSIFGPRAATIAAWCAIHAHAANQDGLYRLWLQAFKQLDSTAANQRA